MLQSEGDVLLNGGLATQWNDVAMWNGEYKDNAEPMKAVYDLKLSKKRRRKEYIAWLQNICICSRTESIFLMQIIFLVYWDWGSWLFYIFEEKINVIFISIGLNCLLPFTEGK